MTINPCYIFNDTLTIMRTPMVSGEWVPWWAMLDVFIIAVLVTALKLKWMALA